MDAMFVRPRTQIQFLLYKRVRFYIGFLYVS